MSQSLLQFHHSFSCKNFCFAGYSLKFVSSEYFRGLKKIDVLFFISQLKYWLRIYIIKAGHRAGSSVTDFLLLLLFLIKCHITITGNFLVSFFKPFQRIVTSIQEQFAFSSSMNRRLVHFFCFVLSL